MPDEPQFPSRTEEQMEVDGRRTREQIRQMGEGFTSARPIEDLDEKLLKRHADKEGALQFVRASRLRSGQVFVAARDLLVSAPDLLGRDDLDGDLTDNRRFERRAIATNESPCVALDELVRVYTYGSGTSEEAVEAVESARAFLRSENVAAAPPMITALHAGGPGTPPGPIVLKSTDGPAPTSVTAPRFTESPDDQVVVAVIDTGIDAAMREHDRLLDEVVRDDNIDLLDVFPMGGRLDFGAGHGTFVAGIVRLIDHRATIVVYRALDTDGVGSEVDVACAMIRAADDGAHVIVLSLGTQAVDDDVPCPALQAAVTDILSRDDAPAIVASAGNYGTEERVYPAALEGVISVAALRAVDPEDGSGAPWSSHGDWVRCSAVGEGIVSTYVVGQEDPQFGGDDVYPQGEGDSWAVWSGTSFAAPQIAGLIALECRSRFGVAPHDVANQMFPTAGRPTDGYGHRSVVLAGTPPLP